MVEASAEPSCKARPAATRILGIIVQAPFAIS
jgi:hypothetical protein